MRRHFGSRPGLIPMVIALLPEIGIGLSAADRLSKGDSAQSVAQAAGLRLRSNYVGLDPKTGQFSLSPWTDGVSWYGILPNYGMKVGGIIAAKVGKKLHLDKFRVPFVGRLF